MPQKAPQENTIIIGQPIGGVVRAVAREEQPPNTAVDANNVVPYDSIGRRRIGQRWGTSIFTESGQSSPVQGMLPIGYILQPGAFVGPLAPINWSTIYPPSTVDPNGNLVVSTVQGPFVIAHTGPELAIQISVNSLLGSLNPPAPGLSSTTLIMAVGYQNTDATTGTIILSWGAQVQGAFPYAGQVSFGCNGGSNVPDFTPTPHAGDSYQGSTFIDSYLIVLIPEPAAGIKGQFEVNGMNYNVNPSGPVATFSTWTGISTSTSAGNSGGGWSPVTVMKVSP